VSLGTQHTDGPAAPGRVDFGRRVRILRRPRGSVSLRIDLRTAGVCLALTGLGVLVALIALGLGDFRVSVPDVVRALFGASDRAVGMVVVDWRLPRVLLALLLGAALGLSGGIFQSLTRNPLGSPDIVGFNTGAYTGALLVIVFVGGDHYLTAGGALVGGIVTAAAVYLLAFRRGVQGFRLIIVGIAVAAVLGSVNTWLLLRADLQTAMSAAVWGAGSLNGLGWGSVTPVAVLLAVLLPCVAVLGPKLKYLELGDDTARALGLRAEPLRLGLIVVGVALTAVATAAAGPISFVALAAPQVARRLTRTPGVGLLPAALLGAVLLLVSDQLAQHALPADLPVGVVTVSIGGAYLIWLLVKEARRQ
jgi:iron complex transport system permease protein